MEAILRSIWLENSWASLKMSVTCFVLSKTNIKFMCSVKKIMFQHFKGNWLQLQQVVQAIDLHWKMYYVSLSFGLCVDETKCKLRSRPSRRSTPQGEFVFLFNQSISNCKTHECIFTLIDKSNQAILFNVLSAII